MHKHPHMQEWLDDLRDPANQSKQGRARLQSGADKFCCLGRLCLVAEQHGVLVERTLAGRIRGQVLTDQPGVLRWVGGFMHVDDGIVVEGRDVAAYNDHVRLTFAQIADRLDPQ